VALVDRALALDRLAVTRLDDFGHKIEAIGIALFVTAVVDHNDIRLGIIARRDRREIDTDTLIRHALWAMSLERIDKHAVQIARNTPAAARGTLLQRRNAGDQLPMLMIRTRFIPRAERRNRQRFGNRTRHGSAHLAILRHAYLRYATAGGSG